MNAPWYQFEQVCHSVIQHAVDHRIWRLKVQPQRTYNTGETLRMDFHLAERRQGGNSVVIDCKHFPQAPLNLHEIESTVNYKVHSRAALAIMMISNMSRYTKFFPAQAQEHNVPIVVVDPSGPQEAILRLRDLLNQLAHERTFQSANPDAVRCDSCGRSLPPQLLGATARRSIWDRFIHQDTRPSGWDWFVRQDDGKRVPLCNRCATKLVG